MVVWLFVAVVVVFVWLFVEVVVAVAVVIVWLFVGVVVAVVVVVVLWCIVHHTPRGPHPRQQTFYPPLLSFL